MQRLFFWRELFLFSLLLFCGLNTYAASVSDLKTSYPTDFGQILVGGAVIKPSTVQWVGTDNALNIYMYGSDVQFGLTGNAVYVSDANIDTQNAWVMSSPQNMGLISPISGSAPSIGYFFAPYQAGLQMNIDTYYLNYQSQGALIKTVNVQGTGVADDTVNPNLTLDVAVQGGVVSENCADMQNCKYVNVPLGGIITFTVTPQKKIGTNVDYVFINIQTDEIGVNCTSGNFTFNDKRVSQNSIDLSDYYQVLDNLGPNGGMQGICYGRASPAIKSIGKPFQFSATNIRETKAGGYAQYRFYLNGHWDINDTTNSKWKGSGDMNGSNIVYRLRTNNNVAVQPQNPTANFTVIGDGSSSVTLNAVTGANIDTYQWTVDGFNTTNTTSTLTLTQAGPHSVSLQVTDKAGKQSSNKNQISVTVAPQNAGTTIPQPTVSFVQTAATSSGVTFEGTVARGPVPVKLTFTTNTTLSIKKKIVVDGKETDATTDAIEGIDYVRDNQDPAKPIVTFIKPGTYTIVAKVSTKSASDTTSTSLTVVVLPSATNNIPVSFVVTPASDNPYKITATAAVNDTANATYSYDWIITNITNPADKTPINLQYNHLLPSLQQTLSAGGTYLIELRVYDSTNRGGAASQVIVLPWLSANFTATPNALKIDLNAQASTGSNLTYNWFVSGATAITDTANKVFTTVSDATHDALISLVVSDKTHSVSSSQLVRGNEPQAPIISEFTATPVTSSTGEGLSITLKATASDPDGGVISKYTWGWDCNNGSVIQTAETKTEQPTYNVKCLNNKGGIYKFTLTVTDDEPVPLTSDAKSYTFTLNLPKVDFPKGLMGVTPLNEKTVMVQSGQSVTLESIASVDGAFLGQKMSKLAWELLDSKGASKGSGSSSSLTGTTVTIAYPVSMSVVPGTYQIKVTATDNYGLNGYNGTGYIIVTPPAIPDAKAHILHNTPSGDVLPQEGLQPATFYAGVFDMNNVLVSPVPPANTTSIKSTSSVQLLASIATASDVNSPASLLVVLCKSGKCYYKNTSGAFVFWDVSNIVGLGSATNEINPLPLDYVSHIPVWNNGTMADLAKTLPLTENATGEYLLFVGYRLASGNIVFNLPAFNFTVTQ